MPISSWAISPERFAVAADGAEEDDEVLHGAAEHRADEDPQGAGQIAELGGQHGADQRAGSGDGGEVVAEDDPFVGGHEVLAVAERSAGVARRSSSAITLAAIQEARSGRRKGKCTPRRRPATWS